MPPTLSNVVAIAAGGWHNLALKSDGTVVAWGAGGPSTNQLVACGQNVVPAGLSNVQEIAAGSVHSLALAGNGPPILKVVLSVAALGTNGFTASIPSRNGHVYRLEFALSLSPPTWMSLPLQAGTGAQLKLIDPLPHGPRCFYRVREW